MKKREVLQYLKEEIISGEEIDYIRALGEGFSRLHPDSELVWLSLPKKDEKARQEILENALPLLGKRK